MAIKTATYFNKILGKEYDRDDIRFVLIAEMIAEKKAEIAVEKKRLKAE